MAQFPGAASPKAIAARLQDLSFPAHKRQLLQHARKVDASAEIRAALKELPEREYTNLAELTRELAARQDVRGRGDRGEHARHDSPVAHRSQEGRAAAHPRDGGAPTDSMGGELIPQLAHVLKELRFPAGTRAIADHAQREGASAQLLGAIATLPPRDFDTIDEVFAAFDDWQEGRQKGDASAMQPAGRNLRQAQNLQNVLGDAIFPAWKEDLTARARDNGADDELCEALSRLPQRQYGDVSEVQKALGGGADSSRQSRGSPSGGRPVN